MSGIIFHFDIQLLPSLKSFKLAFKRVDLYMFLECSNLLFVVCCLHMFVLVFVYRPNGLTTLTIHRLHVFKKCFIIISGVL